MVLLILGRRVSVCNSATLVCLFSLSCSGDLFFFLVVEAPETSHCSLEIDVSLSVLREVSLPSFFWDAFSREIPGSIISIRILASLLSNVSLLSFLRQYLLLLPSWARQQFLRPYCSLDSCIYPSPFEGTIYSFFSRVFTINNRGKTPKAKTASGPTT